MAVLTEEPIPQQTNDNGDAEPAVDVEVPKPATKTKPKSRKAKAEPIKLKTKTKAKLKNNNEAVSDQEVVRPKATRSGRQQRATTASAIQDTSSNIPEIGTASYELYRTLTADDKDLDDANNTLSKSSSVSEVRQNEVQQAAAEGDLHSAPIPSDVLPDAHETAVAPNLIVTPKKRGARTKSKSVAIAQAPIAIVEKVEPAPRKIRGRRNQVIEPIPVVEDSGRRRITAAAKKHYTEPPASEPAPEPESIAVVTAPTPQPIEDSAATLPEGVNDVPPQKTRGRKGKKAIETPAEAIAVSPPNRSVRATRHNTNGNKMQVGPCRWTVGWII